MAYFTVTSTSSQQAIINGNSVSKVVDVGAYRTIYQGSEAFNHQVTDTLANILTKLQS